MPVIVKKKSVHIRPQDLSGKWKIIEMPDLSEDYLSQSKDPHIMITAYKRGRVSGHYQYGLCEGELDGEVVAESEGKPLEIRFSFEGSDEMEQVNGYGVATLSDDNKTLTGKLHYHMGDDWRFTCRRAR